MCLRFDNSTIVDFTVKGIWDHMRDLGPAIPWTRAVWFHGNIPKHAFIMWLAINGRLATKDRLNRIRNVNQPQLSSVCVLCNSVTEVHEHLFFDCTYAREVWDAFKGIIGLQAVDNCLSNVVSALISQPSQTKAFIKTQRIAVAAVTYAIWRERNQRIFKKQKRKSCEVIKWIHHEIRLKLMSIKFNNVLDISHFRTIWRIPLEEPD